ncbi:hypothetical protein [Lactococcus garvieae]|jgi:hypothetical protein|uniref:hypothetical protein n=1 Tax=Lactococcus garvieae TaxID=1363 RepID=UPI0009C0A55C|nr:hypothetical protein [Lactococcus garvieae]QPS71668.1 hypothetical protein I6G50_03100 [Lactococcus garvieae]
MIVINVAMMQEKVIQLLEENGFQFKEKQGLKLFFKGPGTDSAADALSAKSLIKQSSFGSALFFNVEEV